MKLLGTCHILWGEDVEGMGGGGGVRFCPVLEEAGSEEAVCLHSTTRGQHVTYTQARVWDFQSGDPEVEVIQGGSC